MQMTPHITTSIAQQMEPQPPVSHPGGQLCRSPRGPSQDLQPSHLILQMSGEVTSLDSRVFLFLNPEITYFQKGVSLDEDLALLTPIIAYLGFKSIVNDVNETSNTGRVKSFMTDESANLLQIRMKIFELIKLHDSKVF